MITKKVCLLGSFAVGKTSLVGRFVKGIYSDKYLSTLGVKIDKKLVETPVGAATLLLWDLAGDDGYQRIKASYLEKSGGFLVVVDGTRKSTLDQAMEILGREDVKALQRPFILLINKLDLIDSWEVDEDALAPFTQQGVPIYKTSAKTGEAVEEAFTQLTVMMLNQM